MARWQKEAYTLTEILTVLGIVGVLAAIVLPVFFAVRENGHKTVCVSNLRQIGHAFSQYVSDYDGVFSGAVAGFKKADRERLRGVIWTRSLFPYTNKTYLVCPDRELPGAFAKLARAPKSSYHDTLTGYAMNDRISEEVPGGTRSGAFRVSGKAEALFRRPSLSILVFDARTGIAAMNYPDGVSEVSASLAEKWRASGPEAWGINGYDAELEGQSGASQRHGGGANYVFADNHVKWLKPDEISPSIQSDGVRPGFGL